MQTFIINSVIYSFSIFLVGKLTKLYEIRDFPAAFFMAISFGIINAIFGRVLHFLALPFHLITLGITYFLLNGFLLNFAGVFIRGFPHKGCLSSSIAAVIISLFNIIFEKIFY